MTKWEYRCIGICKESDMPMADELCELGDEGWELTTMVRLADESLLCTFKRELPDYASTEKWMSVIYGNRGEEAD